MNINIKILSLLIILMTGISTNVNGTENITPNVTIIPNVTITPNETAIPNMTITPNETAIPNVTITPNDTTIPNITVVPTATPKITVVLTPAITATETPTSNTTSIPTVTPKTGYEHKSKSPTMPAEPIIIIMPGQSIATSTPTPGVSGYNDFYDKVILAAILGLIGLSYEIFKIKYEHKKKREIENAKEPKQK